jgi:hypothetical protein
MLCTYELAHGVLALSTDEAVDDLATGDRVDRGDALHLEGLRRGRVGVDVDLGQHDLSAGLVDDRLQDGAEGLAGPAPLGPQVDDHRRGHRALEHIGLEGRIAHVDHHEPRIRRDPGTEARRRVGRGR